MKKKMKSKRTAALLAVLMALTLAGCGTSSTTDGNSTPIVESPAVVADAMKEAFAAQGELLEVVDSVFDNYYSIDPAKVNGHKAFISTSFVAEEIAVFGALDNNGADIQKMLEQRLQDLKDSFEGYLPEELASLEANAKVLASNGYYCLLAGSPDAVAAAEKVFNEKTK